MTTLYADVRNILLNQLFEKNSMHGLNLINKYFISGEHFIKTIE